MLFANNDHISFKFSGKCAIQTGFVINFCAVGAVESLCRLQTRRNLETGKPFSVS